MGLLRFIWLLPLCCTGCAALILEGYTTNQVATITDLRFQSVLDNLAIVAANANTLPSYAPMAEGSSQVSETGTLDPKTLWTRLTFRGFSNETLGLTGAINPQPNWTVDAVVQHQQIEALHYALVWAIYGPPAPSSKNRETLDLFQVKRALETLPPGWLGVGKCGGVPHHAMYRSHCKGCWAWVTPEGMPGFSAFTLILQDIATVDYKSLEKEAPTLALKIKYGDGGADAPTVEAKVTKDVRPLIVPPKTEDLATDGPPRNRIQAIIASPPSGLNLKLKNEVFELPANLILTTSEPPNVDPTDPSNLPSAPSLGPRITPSWSAPRANQAK